MKTKKILFPQPLIIDERKMINAEVNAALWEATSTVATMNGFTKRQAIEFGLRAFLLNYNPKIAARLGILPVKPE